MTIFDATYPDKHTSPVYWALAGMDLLLLTRVAADALANYTTPDNIHRDTGVDDVRYVDGLLTDASLFQIACAPKTQHLLITVHGMPRAFKQAAKLFSLSPSMDPTNHGPAVVALSRRVSRPRMSARSW